MGKVQLLSDDLINKIAAGEVVERPASVVKELAENAIDAGATRIDVDIERGGKRMIRIADDGCGMTQEDAMMALKRHATSKIRSEDDLFRIMTMGFRGEAVPSIASVSRFILETRSEESEGGVRLVVEGGGDPKISGSGRAKGTTIEVRDLFFNLPARCKFLKADGTEFSHIAEAITRLSMAHPDVRFRLTHNGRVQLQAHPTHELRERVASLLGKQVGKAMYPMEFSTSWLELKGVFSRPDVTTQGTKGIYLFVNGRFIRHRGFSHACQEAYRGTIEKGRYPYIVMFLTIDPAEIDVNVHPQKIEVRFQRESEIYGRILSTLRHALSRTPWVESTRSLVSTTPSTTSPSTETTSSVATTQTTALTNHAPSTNTQSTASVSTPTSSVPSLAEEDTPTSSPASVPAEPKAAPRNFEEFQRRFLQAAQAQKLAIGEDAQPEQKLAPLPSAQDNLPFLPGWDPNPKGEQATSTSVPSQAPVQTQTASNEVIRTDDEAAHEEKVRRPVSTFFSSLKYIGQFAQMYLIFENGDTLIYLDQHAAHERIAYQRLLESFDQERIPQQRFLIPPRIELSIVEAQRAEQHSDDLERLGIEIEPFGGQSFALKSVPDILKKGDPRALVSDLLEELSSGKKTASLDQRRDEVLMRMACHGSVRGPHKLTPDEVRALMQQLDCIDFKANCPHGRPIYFEMPRKELEKRFHRT